MNREDSPQAPPKAGMGKARALLRSGRKRLDQIPIQSIWDRVRKDLQVAVEVLGKGTEKAVRKTRTMSDRAGVQYQIYLAQHKLQKSLTELGARVYDLDCAQASSLELKDRRARTLIKKVTTLEKKTHRLKQKPRTSGK